VDERALYEEYQSMHEQMLQIEGEWSGPASLGGEDWESTVSELHSRLDDLRERIDRSQP
jgi:hypothetical protein